MYLLFINIEVAIVSLGRESIKVQNIEYLYIATDGHIGIEKGNKISFSLQSPKAFSIRCNICKAT